MKILQTHCKALSRMGALCLILFISTAVLAQDTLKDSNVTMANPADAWYNQGWIWFVIVIIAIILILTYNRRSSNTHDRFKDKRGN